MKIVQVLSHIDYAIAFQWIAQHLQGRFDLHFIFLGKKESTLQPLLKDLGCTTYFIPLRSKRDYPAVLWRLLRLLRYIRPQVIHTHLFEACFLGLHAAWLLRIPKRIHTRHHATFHHEYFPKAVRWDKQNNRLSTHIVATSKNVAQTLIHLEGVPKEKVYIIPHGFDLEKFQNSQPERIQQLKRYYKIPEDAFPIVGMIARFMHLKGHRYAIEAFRELKKHYPKAFFIFANAKGPDYTMVHQQIIEKLPQGCFIEIPFEKDLFSLYGMMDLFVHVPINPWIEAFGQVYVEALAAGVPSVFTLSGIAHELIKNHYNAIVVPYQSSDAILQGLLTLLNNTSLREQIRKNGIKSVQPFSLQHFIERLKKLYEV